MTTRLIDTNWSQEIVQAIRRDPSELRIVSPFIKTKALVRLLATGPRSVRVVTRYSLADFAKGVSDLDALHRLVDAGAQVRGVMNLHAKVFVLGRSETIITSANLTGAALDRNHEFGVISDEPSVVASSVDYFQRLWDGADRNLTREDLRGWNDLISARLATGRPVVEPDWPDFGADVGLAAGPLAPDAIGGAARAFVKFLGEGDNRVWLDHSTIEEIERSGAHWAVAYPSSQRPRAARDGDVIFIGRMTQEPNDIIVFGRAIARRHKEGKDDATPEEIAERPWKAAWPRYIRLHQATFVAGTLANGVSLNELMDALEANAFAPTQRNIGSLGNTNPRRAYRQKPAVQLTEDGLAWLGERLETCFQSHGVVPVAELDRIGWPRNSGGAD